MGKKKRKGEADMERILEYRLLAEAEHDPDIILDPDEAYEDWIKWMELPPEERAKVTAKNSMPDVRKWDRDDFRHYYKSIKQCMDKDAAWSFLYAKILERAGEGDGSVGIDLMDF